jgi:hypothetical protein
MTLKLAYKQQTNKQQGQPVHACSTMLHKHAW